MKYMLLIHHNPNFMDDPPEPMDQIGAEVGRLIDELTASGEWVGGEGLADVSQAKVVRVRDGVPAVTDGPYLEAKEHLAGYCIIDCDSLDRALEVAATWPDARWMGVEVRPVMTESDRPVRPPFARPFVCRTGRR